MEKKDLKTLNRKIDSHSIQYILDKTEAKVPLKTGQYVALSYQELIISQRKVLNSSIRQGI